jgi:hypothetical protein
MHEGVRRMKYEGWKEGGDGQRWTAGSEEGPAPPEGKAGGNSLRATFRGQYMACGRGRA